MNIDPSDLQISVSGAFSRVKLNFGPGFVAVLCTRNLQLSWIKSYIRTLYA